MANRTTIDSTEKDFHKFKVLIYGVKQNHVVAADAGTGEVFRYQVDENGEVTDIVERATGVVTIVGGNNGN